MKTINWNKLLSYLNVDLWYFNYFVIPYKIIIFIACSIVTRIIEPYKKPKRVPLHYDIRKIDQLLDVFEKRLEKKFRYRSFILNSYNGTEPSGMNHDYGDWCIWYGTYIAYLAVKYRKKKVPGAWEFLRENVERYIDRFIDDKGYLCRGFVWKSETEIERVYNISGDQFAGFVFGLSFVPMDVLLSTGSYKKIISLVDTIIASGYKISDPETGRSYWRDYRLGILAYGGMVPTILSLLRLAYAVSRNNKYLKEYNRFMRHGAWMLVAVPFGTLFDFIEGYVHNCTIMSLAALANLSSGGHSNVGIRWTWWINRRHYNPFWTALAKKFSGVPIEDFLIAKYQLSTVDEINEKYLDFTGAPIPDDWDEDNKIEYKKYFRVFGGVYTTLPPKYSYKRPDMFPFQRTERMAKEFGILNDNGDENTEHYNMIYFILTAYLI